MKRHGGFCLWGALVALFYADRITAQPLTLSEAISYARGQSVEALEAKQAFISTYWQWRSYLGGVFFVMIFPKG